VKDAKLVWSDELGDMRKKKDDPVQQKEKDDSPLLLRRLTSGKGRTVIEISALPSDQKWCEDLAKELKKKLAVGGSFKDAKIEIHCQEIEKLTAHLDRKKIKWKKIGG
jgi:translation initiation factor 1